MDGKKPQNLSYYQEKRFDCTEPEALIGRNFRRVSDKENCIAWGYCAASEKWHSGLKNMRLLTLRMEGILKEPLDL